MTAIDVPVVLGSSALKYGYALHVPICPEPYAAGVRKARSYRVKFDFVPMWQFKGFRIARWTYKIAMRLIFRQRLQSECR